VVSGRASAVLGPTPFTNQRHERDGAQIFLFEFSLALAGKLEQRLMTFFLADRNDQTTADRELFLQRRRYLRSACCDQDRIKGCCLGPPTRTIGDAQFDIVVAELLEALPGSIAQRWVTFNGIVLPAARIRAKMAPDPAS